MDLTYIQWEMIQILVLLVVFLAIFVMNYYVQKGMIERHQSQLAALLENYKEDREKFFKGKKWKV